MEKRCPPSRYFASATRESERRKRLDQGARSQASCRWVVTPALTTTFVDGPHCSSLEPPHPWKEYLPGAKEKRNPPDLPT